MDRDLFGLSTRKVCHASEITFETGELLPHLFTFSPNVRGSLFSVALSVPDPDPDKFLSFDRQDREEGLPVRKYDALCCPDFPPRVFYLTIRPGVIGRLALQR